MENRLQLQGKEEWQKVIIDTETIHKFSSYKINDTTIRCKICQQQDITEFNISIDDYNDFVAAVLRGFCSATINKVYNVEFVNLID